MNFSYDKFTFPSYNNENQVVSHIYTPTSKKPVAVFHIIHGMSEYIRRYEDFAEYLCEKGFIVCGCDHIGHGESIKDLEDLGYFYSKEADEVMVRDVRTFFLHNKKEYKNLPYIMFGHSMGSMVLRKYIIQYGEKDFNGAIISGTTGPNKLLALGLVLAKAINLVKGSRYISSKIDKMMFGAYNDRIPNPQTKFDWLTRDNFEVKKYTTDEKCGFIFSISGIISLMNMIKFINKKDNYKLYPKNLPTFIISGSMDPVGNYTTGVREVYESLMEETLTKLSIKIYDDARHELINETNKSEVYEDIYNWCKSLL